MDRLTVCMDALDKHKAICPPHFFEAGGIKMRIRYSPESKHIIILLKYLSMYVSVHNSLHTIQHLKANILSFLVTI